MFPAVAVKTRTPQRNLYLVWSRPGGIAKGETKMNNYRFAAYPSHSSIAAGVTVLVSAWFLVAAGAILSDPSSPYTRKVISTPAPVKAAQVQPYVYETIRVSAKRLPANRTAT